MKKERELKPIVQSPNAKPVQMRATFDNQMKTALSLNVKNWKGSIYCCKFQNKLKMLLSDIF